MRKEENMNYDKIIEIVKSTKSIVTSVHLQKQIKIKGEADFVTAVDLTISRYIKESLLKLYPSIGFFSEEESGRLSDPCWILDPIDGTTNLIFGYRMSSVSLGLYSKGKIVFGIVYNPFTEECFTATIGNGSYVNGRLLKVSNRKISDSVIEFGAGSTRKKDADVNFEIAKEIFKNCIDIRRICSSALALCFIADSRIDGYFEKCLKPWDVAAGSLILEEAGGLITDYFGKPLQFDEPTSVIASNGITHSFLGEIIKKYSEGSSSICY